MMQGDEEPVAAKVVFKTETENFFHFSKPKLLGLAWILDGKLVIKSINFDSLSFTELSALNEKIGSI